MSADAVLQIAPKRGQAYAEIADYAVIGNCRTIALVSRFGSIDWLCVPHFSEPSIFGALLDRERGGRLAITPHDVSASAQSYVERTNVLQTMFQCAGGELRVTDFMTIVPRADGAPVLEPEHELVRIVECIKGEVELDAEYAPRPDYARAMPQLRRRGKLGWACAHCGLITILMSDLEFAAREDNEATLVARATLHAGDRRYIVWSYSSNDIAVINPLGAAIDRRLELTVGWWRSWCAQCGYDGVYRDAVIRSALTLKLLAYSPSGAVIAAATTSLPESSNGARNWDYRYCWLRDTSLVLQSFLDLGFIAESEAFLGWLLHATRLTHPRLQVLYDVYGETHLEERELRHLEGHGGIGPVRIGNAAHEQVQLDIYGDLILTVFDFVDRGGKLDRPECNLLVGFVRSVRELWRQPDRSIWEIRLPARHNTYSKLMCWTALDRTIELEKRLKLGVDAAALESERDAIRADIDANAFDAGLGSYVGFYGGRAPDASLLLMARYGFLPADDPRMIATSRYIERELSIDGLLYRYPPGGAYDGVPGEENLFGICSFWLVDYLARLGEADRAAKLFEQLLGLANPVGLYAEEFDAVTKTARGNFPQAFTHVGLITAALAIAQAARGRKQSIAR